MKVPKEITLEWLNEKRGQYSTRAQELAYDYLKVDGVRVNIPKEVWPQFLDLPSSHGDTIFAYMCSTKQHFRLIPRKFMSRGRLTFERRGFLEKTPLEQIVRIGLTCEVPWGEFNPKKWIQELDKLKDAANGFLMPFVPKESKAPLKDFILKVEQRKALSEIEKINM
jgi:hypothetical protein